MYQTSIGTMHMRCNAEMPDTIKPFPIYLRKAGYYGTGFQPESTERGVYVLPGIVGYEEKPELLDESLDRVLKMGHPRIIFYADRARSLPCRYIHTRIEQAGYTGKEIFRDFGCLLIEYTKVDQQ